MTLELWMEEIPTMNIVTGSKAIELFGIYESYGSFPLPVRSPDLCAFSASLLVCRFSVGRYHLGEFA